MITLTYSDARAKLADVFDQAIEQPVTITRRSAPDVVVISAEQYAAFQQARFETAMKRVTTDNHEVLKALADK
ncbi:type II toxin-antitoxin system Phd/YefM family antitoxin [Brenneria populi subsp. brevivirga]|uniref:type II toxin-antitoxin system Phd/YefM family antitoxin n=1 Tax=Brenneria populi TaxID=1505588 RepID=UPI002E180E8B|nr:type II toxin-antitoxin system Phd/YefM family antitoxin [Brenneria populi subsp. brevivirga]